MRERREGVIGVALAMTACAQPSPPPETARGSEVWVSAPTHETDASALAFDASSAPSESPTDARPSDAGLTTMAGPSLRQGPTSAKGRLPPEAIQRIIRVNFGRFGLCYKDGLRRNANLKGRVTTRFTIDPSGAVRDARDDGSDLPDATVIACFERGFASLVFPRPEEGEVEVVYPIILAPHGEAFTPVTR